MWARRYIVQAYRAKQSVWDTVGEQLIDEDKAKH